MIKKAYWYKKLVLLLCFTVASGMVGTSLVNADTKNVETNTEISINKDGTDNKDEKVNKDGTVNATLLSEATSSASKTNPVEKAVIAATAEIVSISVPTASKGDMIIFTKQQAMDKAVETNNNMKKVQFGLNTIQRGFDQAKDASSQATALLNAVDDYRKIYNRYQDILKSPLVTKKSKYDAKIQAYKEVEGTLTEEEKTKWQAEIKALKLTPEEETSVANMSLDQKDMYKLKVYQGMFAKYSKPGSPLPVLTNDDVYQLQYAKQIPWDIAETKLRQTLNKKETVTNTIEIGMNKLYDGVLQMQDGYSVQSKLYEEQKKEYGQAVIKCQLGAISELDRKKAEIDLRKLELQKEQLRIKLENLQTQLRQLIGIPLTQPLTIRGTLLDGKRTLADFEGYLKTAKEKRTEITDPLADGNLNQRKLDLIDQYYNKEDSMYKEAVQTKIESEDAQENGVRLVTKDIRSAYLDVKKQEAAIDMATKNLEKANIQYEAAKISYEIGVQPITLKWKAELGKAKAEIEYRKLVLDYNNQLFALEKASDLGPSYVTKGATK